MFDMRIYLRALSMAAHHMKRVSIIDIQRHSHIKEEIWKNKNIINWTNVGSNFNDMLLLRQRQSNS